LFQPARCFGAESVFLKQPVAEASINSEPFTLRVPVNGARYASGWTESRVAAGHPSSGMKERV